VINKERTMQLEMSVPMDVGMLIPELKQLGVKKDRAATPESRTAEKPASNAGKYKTDPRLVQACLDGNETAWNELVERYQRLVFSIPRKYGLSTADAQDVMQNVFEIIYRRLETLRDHTILSSWIIRITHRATLHYLKQGRVDNELIDEMCGFEDVDTKQLEQLETQYLVRQAVERLDEQSRELIMALLTDPPPSYEALAKKLDCPVGSIGPTRARAINKLKKILHDMDVAL